MIETLLIALASMLILGNGYACYLIQQSQLHSPAQKKLQILFVWLIPIFGGIFTCAIHSPAAKNISRSSNNQLEDDTPFGAFLGDRPPHGRSDVNVGSPDLD